MTIKTTQDQINEGLAKVSQNTAKKTVKFAFLEPDEQASLTKSQSQFVLEKSLLNSSYEISKGGSITRLSFEEDPQKIAYYQSLWKPKRNMVPDELLKRLSIQDDLVAAITLARSNHISAFGRELQDRFSTGFRIEPRKGIMESASEEEKKELQERISDVSKRISSCGSLEGVEDDERENFSSFLYQTARNSIVFGRFATEKIYVTSLSGRKEFHSFRAVDAGTIYQASPHNDAAKSIRSQALRLLARLKNEDLSPEKFKSDEYKWIQVSQGRPIQAFTNNELGVCNIYPLTDIELGGYPITPIDTAIAAITTHINITNHNKLYFQSGRAARGMIVIKSADVDQGLISQIKQQFNASINGVSNSWRVPVFGIDPEEEVRWEPMEMQGGRDMEYQFLSDQNSRVILSAFQMSPEELPGYQHLSRGTNNQGLSESNNEYRLTAARDVGIRPLLAKIQDFINDTIIPLLDKEVSQLCTFKFYGLDADTQEKEDTRLQQETSIHLTYDQIMNRTEKQPIGKEWGGEFPLNPAIQSVFDKYLTVGEILENFFGKKGASKDPALQYRRDPFYFSMQNQLMQIEQQKQQMAMQQQQQAQSNSQQPDGGGEQPQNGPQEEQGPPPSSGELESDAGQVEMALGKSEAHLSPNKRRLLAQHNATVKHIMDNWEKESQELLEEVVSLTSKKTKKK